MHPKALLYASEPKITPAQLRDITSVPDLQATKISERAEKYNIHAFVHEPGLNHFKLQQIKSPPYITFAQGDMSILDKPIIAIVGPRRMSSYAEHILNLLFEQLRKYNLVTISGLAEGVDTVAHTLSIQHQIPTIAVLGSGIRHFQQSHRADILHTIVDAGGLILSEYKPDQAPQKFTYPQRNRIVAGLADIIIVPEAGEKSGSLITVDFAIAMHKPVYGFSSHYGIAASQGMHNYIAAGKVSLIADIQQVLDAHFHVIHTTNNTSNLQLTPDEHLLRDLFMQESVWTTQQLMQHAKLPLSHIISTLTMLEMKGLVYQSSPSIYQVC